jgi:hypothetical protein
MFEGSPPRQAGFQLRGKTVVSSDCFTLGKRVSKSRKYCHGSIPRRRQLTITE